MRVFRLCLALIMVVSVAACAVNEDSASDEDIRQVVYSHDGPPRLTLYTMVSNDTGAGAHTSLLINGSQRVAWDPAGSFRAESIVARGDVVYGMTPKMVDVYTRFHARETYHVIIQELDVSPEVAEIALRRAQSFGAVAQSQCALSTGKLLKGVPGFEDVPVTYYPNKLMEAFAKKGPRTRELFEYDGDDKTKVLAAFNAERVAETRARRRAEAEAVVATAE
ncbi:MAG: hypothetical protein GYB25_05580 [Rhodobacteraceae bacterium]|nr:hypothetical protein [Paracoccaceae bacterium]